jgi:aspartate/methionine/tyrosine aminotransferase
MRDIAPFHVMALVAHAKALEMQGRDIVHLEIGEPDFPVAAPIIDAATRYLAQGRIAYTAASGIPALRSAIARWYATRFGVTVPMERIVITPGASGALQLALAALVSPGDAWLLPDPGYPCNRHFVRLFEGQAAPLPVDATSNFQPTAQHIQAAWTPRTRGLLLASPANPTGTVLTPSELAQLWAQVHSHQGHLIVDEIYQNLIYDSEPHTALSLSDDIFVINSFSKYFGMTGWRLGWMVVPPAFIGDIEKLAQNLFICAPTLAQHAALAAFSDESLAIFEARRIEFAQRRDALRSGLLALGLTLPAQPQGAFYLYADVSRYTDDSYAFAYRLLNEAGVAATPGIDFGEANAAKYMRFAYTTSVERIEEALRRLGGFLHIS